MENKFIKGIQVKDYLPADTEMTGTAMPLYTNQYEENKKITEYLKGREYLKKMLVEKLTT
jgi:hypothetical protein